MQARRDRLRRGLWYTVAFIATPVVAALILAAGLAAGTQFRPARVSSPPLPTQPRVLLIVLVCVAVILVSFAPGRYVMSSTKRALRDSAVPLLHPMATCSVGAGIVLFCLVLIELISRTHGSGSVADTALVSALLAAPAAYLAASWVLRSVTSNLGKKGVGLGNSSGGMCVEIVDDQRGNLYILRDKSLVDLDSGKPLTLSEKIPSEDDAVSARWMGDCFLIVTRAGRRICGRLPVEVGGQEATSR